MLENLKYTSLFKSLNLLKSNNHAYLIYSFDKMLNNNIAKLFAKTLICEAKTACGICDACKQFDSKSHPDYIEIEQESIKVDDVNNFISKLNSKPLSCDKKVILILNSENINEIAQNKLLKSLEEPNPSTVFILSTNKIDKLLPTMLSRLHKVFVPKILYDDFKIIEKDLSDNNINISKYLNSNLNLTDIINYETNTNYLNTIQALTYIFENLKSSQDVPKVSSSIPEFDKNLLLPLLQKVFLDCIQENASFNQNLVEIIKQNYPKQALINSLDLINDAYKKQLSNVNISYILDNLLFNILKEKFLCNQQN